MTDPLTRHGYPTAPRHSLMVCASLVNHPANLGALCRTAEAFRLEALVVRDRPVVNSTAFRGLSASTHHWQPLQVCPVADLLPWLDQQGQAGYTAIALEVCPDAHPLPHFSYPQRSILVLGQELTGIPSAIRDRCPQAITIPQYGLVESLNVHTAAAIAIYEYMRQWGGVVNPVG
jgi:tRNA G18 (ribose-2'-O)-methylase SpoU